MAKKRNISANAQKIKLEEVEIKPYEPPGFRKNSKEKPTGSGGNSVLIYLGVGIILSLLLLNSGFFGSNIVNNGNNTPGNDDQMKNDNSDNILILNNLNIEVYRSADCSCCHLWLEYAENEGANAIDNILSQAELDQMKIENGLTSEYFACHTVRIGDYFFEGHIPASVIADFLADSPDLDGITLPGMPTGSPGMGGQKLDVWEFIGFQDGQNMGVYTTF